MKTYPGLLVGFACLLFVGCVPLKQYRTDLRPQSYPVASKIREKPVVEMAKDYSLGFVEIDDQGWLWNRAQLNAVTNQFHIEAATNGLLIVTFIHGWMHDASTDDQNVEDFRSSLKILARLEKKLSSSQGRPMRRVVGLYVGWRGRSQSVPGINLSTFWNRKQAAERVGHGAATEILCELEKLKERSNFSSQQLIKTHKKATTKLLVIGHSFGGDVVYSAVSPILVERMVQNVDEFGRIRPPRTLGDLVVLVNPAFEAARFETLQRLARADELPAGMNATLAVFTSRDDLATKIAFPAGRFLPIAFESHSTSKQRKANVTAIGHYPPFLTYDLQFVGSKKGPATNEQSGENSVDNVLQIKEQRRKTMTATSLDTADLTYQFRKCRLVPTTICTRSNPVFVVSVDPKIIKDHSAIFGGLFRDFLLEFLNAFSD